MPTPALARRPDVIATPHVGGLTPQAIEHQALETVAQVAEIVKGRAPKGAVNTDKATRLGEARMKTVLITGAAGDVGTHLRRELAGRYRLRLSDLQADHRPRPRARIRARRHRGRIDGHARRSRRAWTRSSTWAASRSRAPWETILRPTSTAPTTCSRRRAANGVKRILFATSNHAVGFYRRDQTIDHRVYPKPDSRYGVSKVFGEALGSLYADKYGMEVFNIRIGNVNPRPVDKRRLSIWISPRDLAQLVTIGIEHPDIRFEIVYGVSGNQRSWYDNSNAERLGYKPQDDSETYAAEVLANEKPGRIRRARPTRAGCSW